MVRYPLSKRTWENEKFMTTLMGSFHSLKMGKNYQKHIKNNDWVEKVYLFSIQTQCSKIIYDMFEETILDFSMGWGDRLDFASEHGKHYVGLDPRKENHPIYEEQSEFYQKHLGFFEHERKCDFHCSPKKTLISTHFMNTLTWCLRVHHTLRLVIVTMIHKVG